MLIPETFDRCQSISSRKNEDKYRSSSSLTRMEINEMAPVLATNGIARHCLLLELSHDRVNLYILTYVLFILHELKINEIHRRAFQQDSSRKQPIRLHFVIKKSLTILI